MTAAVGGTLPSAETRDHRLIAIVVSTALMMHYMDMVSVLTVLPNIARGLGEPPLSLDIVVLAYAVTLAMITPAGAALADRFGARRAYIAALAVFCLGALLSGLSQSVTMLVLSRVVQALGGAIMVPLARLILVRSSKSTEIISAMNWLLIPSMIGPMLGPPLGGLMATYFSWRFVFLINVPIAIVGIIATILLVPEVRAEKPQRFDLLGLCLIAPAVAGIIFGIQQTTQDNGWLSAAGITAIGVIFSAAYCFHSSRTTAPLIDLGCLRLHTFRISVLIALALRTPMAACSFLFPLWFQLEMGMTAAGFGFVMLWATLGGLCARFLGAVMLRYASPRNALVLGCVGVAVTSGMIALLQADMPRWTYYVTFFVYGVIGSLPFFVATPLAYVGVPANWQSATVGFYSVIQQVTPPLGVTIGGALLGGLTMTVHGGFGSGHTYQIAIGILALATLISAILASRLARDAGEELVSRPL